MTEHQQDHALIVYTDHGLEVPQETMDAIGPRGLLIMPLSCRPEPQNLTADDFAEAVNESTSAATAAADREETWRCISMWENLRCVMPADHPAAARHYNGEREWWEAEEDPWAEGTGLGYDVRHLRAGLEGIRDMLTTPGRISTSTEVVRRCEAILAGVTAHL